MSTSNCFPHECRSLACNDEEDSKTLNLTEKNLESLALGYLGVNSSHSSVCAAVFFSHLELYLDHMVDAADNDDGDVYMAMMTKTRCHLSM